VGAIVLLLSGVVLLLAYTAYSARHSRVEIRGGELRLVGDLWGRSIPIASLELSRAAVLDLSAAPDYKPRWRTFGTGLPGYASGWFRLRNGEKALAYLTRHDGVVYLPTSLGYSLLLSAERPEELLARLRAQAPG
jgi:hypothetical protein